MSLCSIRHERRALALGATRIAGLDEVGRGSLFGPVVAAAVVLNPEIRIRGLNDSKLLDRAERERLDAVIRRRALAFSIVAVDAGRLDYVNVYQASRIAMEEAVRGLDPAPDFLLVDALRLQLPIAQDALIHGDARCVSIAAASIIAKVYRDRLMQFWDAVFPEYRLGSNKGYSTPDHLAALARFGPTPLHRRSYFPVAESDVVFRYSTSASRLPELQHALEFPPAED
jgi:ribonuclease HII